MDEYRASQFSTINCKNISAFKHFSWPIYRQFALQNVDVIGIALKKSWLKNKLKKMCLKHFNQASAETGLIYFCVYLYQHMNHVIKL